MPSRNQLTNLRTDPAKLNGSYNNEKTAGKHWQTNREVENRQPRRTRNYVENIPKELFSEGGRCRAEGDAEDTGAL